MSILEVNNIRKSFGKTEVLKDISFTLEKGEVLSIIGSSGSGKTTLLRCLNFLEIADCGKIEVDDEVLFDTESKMKLSDEKMRENRLNFGLVFQNFNLFPQYTVLQNLTLAPTLLKKGSAEEIEKKALEIIRSVGLEEKVDFYPCQLSGGQQQRVAIARALVKMPRVLLLDEPLSNLDARLRLQTREEIRRIQRETGITTVFVTHDQEEAMSISDLIVVMKLGVVQQIGKPQEVYDDPTNLFVAKFLGTPPINVFNGHVEGEKLYIGDSAVLDVKGVENIKKIEAFITGQIKSYYFGVPKKSERPATLYTTLVPEKSNNMLFLFKIIFLYLNNTLLLNTCISTSSSSVIILSNSIIFLPGITILISSSLGLSNVIFFLANL